MLPGKCLTKVNAVWEEQQVDVYTALAGRSPAPRIIFIADQLTPDDVPAFEEFAKNDQCRGLMTEIYGFPTYLFSDTWMKCNGFAGLRKAIDSSGHANGYISWFRVLIKKMTNDSAATKSYKWYEMTFFLHQLDAGEATIVCCSYMDRFLHGLQKELNDAPVSARVDWKFLQAVLLRQLVHDIDSAVWVYSKEVRKLEKGRPKTQNSLHSSFDFPRLHDLLRHTVHCTELLEVATQTLREWIQRYHADQEAIMKNDPAATVPLHIPYYDDLSGSLQIIRNLAKRSSSNEARLRNEINLAFNVVSQQDTKAVRIISFVTLAFLPATFVSTLFSMSFFNYQSPKGSHWAVATEVWIYFVIAVPLTAITIMSWMWGPAWIQWAADQGWSRSENP